MLICDTNFLSIAKNRKIILKNGVFIYPTDTCYGLGCLITSKEGIDKIYEIKDREREKPLSIMVNSLDMMKMYGVYDQLYDYILPKILPGKYTFITEKTDRVPNFLNKNNSSVGIRYPDNDFCMKLINAFNLPIITTSANISNQKSLYNIKEIKEIFRDFHIDILFDGGDLDYIKSSTVIDIRNSPPKILREGSGDANLVKM